MNEWSGSIESIKGKGNLSLVKVNANEVIFTALVVEAPDVEHLQAGKSIRIIFKETEVILVKGDQVLSSVENHFPGKVISLEKGEVLSRIELEAAPGMLCALITEEMQQKLRIKIGDDLQVQIKASEVMLSE